MKKTGLILRLPWSLSLVIEWADQGIIPYYSPSIWSCSNDEKYSKKEDNYLQLHKSSRLTRPTLINARETKQDFIKLVNTLKIAGIHIPCINAPACMIAWVRELGMPGTPFYSLKTLHSLIHS